jgi:hypothetical protein
VKPNPLPLLVWATFLAALAGMLWIWTDDAIPIALLGGAALATAVVAAVAALAGRTLGEEVRWVPDMSLATAVIAAGLTAVVLGAEAGLWLVYAGVGMTLFGVAGLVRESAGARKRRGR